MKARKALGKGLEALIPGASERPAGAAWGQAPRAVPVERIAPNRFQPRMGFDGKAIDRLVESIREQGLIEPLVVRPAPEGMDADFELVAGERRWRAVQKLGLDKAPVIVKELDDRQALEMALTENLQREDLNPIEEARAYKILKDEFRLTQIDISKHVGVDRSTVANSLRLLALDERIQEDIARGFFSPGHARALMALDEPDREKLRREIIDRGLTVRQAELKSRQIAVPPRNRKKLFKGQAFDDAVEEMARKMQNALGTKVNIKVGARGGKIEIRFHNRGEMEGIFNRILGE